MNLYHCGIDTALSVYLLYNGHYLIFFLLLLYVVLIRLLYILRIPYVLCNPIRDFQFFCGNTILLWKIKSLQRKNATIIDLFYEVLAKNPDKVCFYCEGRQITFKEVEELSNKIGSIFSTAGFKKGDVVGLLMENRVEYPVIWLGLAKIGVVTSLINTNLRSDPLLHAINIVNCKGFIVSYKYYEAINDIKRHLPNHVKFYTFKDKHPTNNPLNIKAENLRSLLFFAKSKKLPPCPLNFSDNVLYIYTSGTTGLPKAAKITNAKIVLLSISYTIILKMNVDTDVIYSPMPLYHLASGILGVVPALFRGMTVVLREKFSASNLIKECIKYKCTAVQYIGETSRYLTLTPSSEDDRKHNIRKFLGNGLRPDIWEKLIGRFGVTDINEFYGSSEGNASMCNFEGKIGAVGFMPNLVPDSVNLFALLKYDLYSQLPIRDASGFCIRVKRGEPGLLVTKIKKNCISEFYGYADKKESEKKIITDAFEEGDMYYNTGDILKRDYHGYYYFVDRIGDTFRWKGENVSTTEVENVISKDVKYDLCVYGVEVKGCEGRAGMVTINVGSCDNIDMESIAQTVKDLPTYARPLFIRLTKEMDLTSTFKIKKVKFREEGFQLFKDPIYFLKEDKYVELTSTLYEEINSEKIRF